MLLLSTGGLVFFLVVYHYEVCIIQIEVVSVSAFFGDGGLRDTAGWYCLVRFMVGALIVFKMMDLVILIRRYALLMIYPGTWYCTLIVGWEKRNK